MWVLHYLMIVTDDWLPMPALSAPVPQPPNVSDMLAMNKIMAYVLLNEFFIVRSFNFLCIYSYKRFLKTKLFTLKSAVLV